KKRLALVLLLCSLPSLTNAFCQRRSPIFGMTHCTDEVDNTWHAVGSSWRNSECMDCTCDECCSAYYIPREIPTDCVSVFDSKACVYKVHKKDDPTKIHKDPLK
uniref:Beta-microseminoprotein n=1 Tax=Echeneis naucrates TaxID=173247 RepID=A0A665W419_ECHNA